MQLIEDLPNGFPLTSCIDLDGDGDSDILVVSSQIAWYENLGGGVFNPQAYLADAFEELSDFDIGDIDGDGDLDIAVIQADGRMNNVAWYSSELVVSVYESQTKPTHSIISGVFPNPFNPSTTIEYELTIPSVVTVNIHDIQGRHIQTLVNTSKLAGRYQAIWNGIFNPIYYKLRRW